MFLQFKNRDVGVLEKENSLTVTLRVRSDREKAKKLTFKTFKKWPFKEDISAETSEQVYIM